MTAPNLSPEEKRERLAHYLRQRLNEPYVLQGTSYGQQAMWFLHQLAPESTAYNIMHAARVRFAIDVPVLRRAFQAVSNRHAILRTTYMLHEGKPVQVVHRRQVVDVAVTDASGWNAARLEDELRRSANRPFSLERGPVWRVGVFTCSSEEHIILLCFHHIAVDFWSLSLLLHEVQGLYGAGGNLEDAELLPAVPYSQYVRWQQSVLAGETGEVLRRYWERQLAGVLPDLDLPTDRARPPHQTYVGARQTLRLSDGLVARLSALARAEGFTVYTVLLAAFQALLHRYTGQVDILIGSPMTVRGRVEFERLVGYAINPVVLRADLSSDPSFTALLARVRATVLGAIEHQDYPFPLLVEHLQPARDPSRSPIFQTMFIWDKPHLGEPETGGMRWELVASEQCGSAVDLTLTVFELPEAVSAVFQYNSDLFDGETIARMAVHFEALLKAAIAWPEQPISELPLLTAAERRMAVVEWNATDRLRSDRCIHELIEGQAKRSPDAVAVVSDDQELTYGELDQRASQLAHHLRAAGIEADTLVGISLGRSASMVVAMLAVLKSGGAYVPLDPTYPSDRLALMLKDSAPRAVIADEKAAARLPRCDSQMIYIDRDWDAIAISSEQPSPAMVMADSLAYVIYTSGSTGLPNGVEVTHRNVVNFLEAMQARPGLRRNDVLLAVTSLSFDIAALEVFLPLTVGATVAIAPEEDTSDGARLLERLRVSGATVMQATPVTWRLLVKAGWQGDPPLTVLCGGEALPSELASRLLERSEAVWNLYGPTETTIWSTIHRVDSRRVPIAIGRPIANTQAYVLDAQLNPVPIGIVGEIYIGGLGVARGYRHRPELTAERFIGDPFRSEPGARLFRTRDLGRCQPDGSLEFLGRADQQVKVRGFRIELQEIETALREHPAVDQAVVVAVTDGTKDTSLVAYLTLHQDGDRSSSLSGRGSTEVLAVQQQPYVLPNGMRVVHHTPFQTDAIYKEIFTEETYLNHGITLEDGDCVVDVGANIGLFSLFVHERIRHARIVAFEPLPPNFELLRQNIALNAVDAECYPYALSDRPGRAQFTFYPHVAALSGRYPEGTKEFTQSVLHSWLRTLQAQGQPSGEDIEIDELVETYLLQHETYSCRLHTLSELIDELALTDIDLLKIDVEKSEVDVIRGVQTAHWPRIRQVAMEIHSNALLDKVRTVLAPHGYDIRVDKTIVVEEPNEYVHMLYARRSAHRAKRDRASAPALITRPRATSGPPPTSQELRRFLARTLPPAMVPSSFVFLHALPLTANGKIDRRALARPETAEPVRDARRAVPHAPLEGQLVEICSRVLDIDGVDIHDNFFDLGGTSLHTVEIVTQAAELGLEVTPEMLFEHQTIAELAAALSVQGTSETDDA